MANFFIAVATISYSLQLFYFFGPISVVRVNLGNKGPTVASGMGAMGNMTLVGTDGIARHVINRIKVPPTQ